MAEITLISGSTLGSAEYVAEHLAGLLDAEGFNTSIHHGPALKDLSRQGIWLVITSTHGAGDLPDNLQSLYDELNTQRPDLQGVQFGAIGIGSREYDTFCGAVEKMDFILRECGATRLGDVLKINILDHEIPEDPAEVWLKTWQSQIPIV